MKKELFIVDDNPDHHFLLYKILKQFTESFPVRFFEDGKALHKHLLTLVYQRRSDNFPGLILVDLNMPGMNGLQLLRLLKDPAQNVLSHCRHIPVVVMSNETREEKIQQCYQAGASAFIIKPSDLEKMTNTLQAICQFWLNSNYVPKAFL